MLKKKFKKKLLLMITNIRQVLIFLMYKIAYSHKLTGHRRHIQMYMLP